MIWKIKWISVLTVLSLILCACALIPVEEPEQPTPLPPEQTPTLALPQAVIAAREKLAALLNIPVDQVDMVKFEKVDWPDGCLGLSQAGEMCTQVVTPGYKVILQVNQTQYIYRTNLDGTLVLSEPPFEKARQKLADELGIGIDAVTVITYEAVDWPDGCLGVQQKGVMCIQVITPGYKITLQANQTTYIYHTNLDGTSMILEPSVDAKTFPAAVLAARQALADKLGVTPDAVTVISYEAVDWPDSCLGVQKKGVMCMQVITPGYRVMLSANDQPYEYHADSTGKSVVLAVSTTTP
jgi:hypothetical protein